MVLITQVLTFSQKDYYHMIFFFLYRAHIYNLNVSSFTEKEFHEELDRLLDVLDVRSPFFLVVQVWINL